jgi:hypothetical protein
LASSQENLLELFSLLRVNLLWQFLFPNRRSPTGLAEELFSSNKKVKFQIAKEVLKASVISVGKISSGSYS